MTDPVDVLELFAESNPVPKEALPEARVDAQTYLSELLQRESGDRSLGKVSAPGAAAAGERWAVLARSRWAYAAVVFVILGLGWLVVRNTVPDDRIVTEPTVTTTTTVPESTTTAPEETTTTLSAEEEAWQSIPRWVEASGAAGEYRSFNFRPDIRFSVPEGWARLPGFGELPNAITPIIGPDGGQPEWAFIVRHDEATVGDVLDFLRDHESMSILSEQPSSLGEAEAVEVRFEMVASMIYIMLNDQEFRPLNGGEAGVIRVAEVDEQIVSAVVVAGGIEDLPAMEEATQPIIDSIHWRALQTGN